MKYLPQRPVELHEIAASPPPAAPPPKVTLRRPAPPATGAASLPRRPKSAAAAILATTRLTAAATTDDQGQGPTPKADHVEPSTTNGKVDNREGLDHQGSTVPVTRPISGGPSRPHSSPSARGGPSPGTKESRRMAPASSHTLTSSPTRNKPAAAASIRAKSAKTEVCTPEMLRPRRPQTADGRDIEATRHQTPVLDDPANPVMIAHR